MSRRGPRAASRRGGAQPGVRTAGRRPCRHRARLPVSMVKHSIAARSRGPSRPPHSSRRHRTGTRQPARRPPSGDGRRSAATVSTRRTASSAPTSSGSASPRRRRPRPPADDAAVLDAQTPRRDRAAEHPGSASLRQDSRGIPAFERATRRRVLRGSSPVAQQRLQLAREQEPVGASRRSRAA